VANRILFPPPAKGRSSRPGAALHSLDKCRFGAQRRTSRYAARLDRACSISARTSSPENPVDASGSAGGKTAPDRRQSALLLPVPGGRKRKARAATEPCCRRECRSDRTGQSRDRSIPHEGGPRNPLTSASVRLRLKSAISASISLRPGFRARSLRLPPRPGTGDGPPAYWRADASGIAGVMRSPARRCGRPGRAPPSPKQAQARASSSGFPRRDLGPCAAATPWRSRLPRWLHLRGAAASR